MTELTQDQLIQRLRARSYVARQIDCDRAADCIDKLQAKVEELEQILDGTMEQEVILLKRIKELERLVKRLQKMVDGATARGITAEVLIKELVVDLDESENMNYQLQARIEELEDDE